MDYSSKPKQPQTEKYFCLQKQKMSSPHGDLVIKASPFTMHPGVGPTNPLVAGIGTVGNFLEGRKLRLQKTIFSSQEKLENSVGKDAIHKTGREFSKQEKGMNCSDVSFFIRI